jgi:hypothetical protein
LLFQERRKEAPHQKKKKKKKGKTAFQLVGRQLLVHSAWTSGAVMCYKKLM